MWWLLHLLFGSVWLWPMVLAAQPFDVERLRHAVVRVLGDRGNNIGSGSLIKVEGRTGYILTASHVPQRDLDQGKTSVKVELYTEQVLDARLSGNRVDYANDIAVLIIDQLPEPPPPCDSMGKCHDSTRPATRLCPGTSKSRRPMADH
jgi:hypothetical protein